jgi:DNA-directed RNA polymerase
MTTVYGVTFIGAKRQIERQLKDQGNIPAEMCYHLATYLAEKVTWHSFVRERNGVLLTQAVIQVLGCIGDLFQGASAIQLWLARCAKYIASSIPEERIPEGKVDPKKLNAEKMTTVAWTTPLGLPVVQPYRKERKSQVSVISFSRRKCQEMLTDERI